MTSCTTRVLEGPQASTYGTRWKNGSTWITADVTSLYTTISHNLALIALQWFPDIYSDYDEVLKLYLIEVTKYLLSHNFFMFNDKFFLQIAKFSPSIANIGRSPGISFVKTILWC